MCAGWGDNRFGQVGTGDKGMAVTHPAVIRDIPRIVSMAAGANHALALSEDGEVLVWGANGSGQLGLEKTGMLSSCTVHLCPCQVLRQTHNLAVRHQTDIKRRLRATDPSTSGRS